jgi:hypothetical protein
MNPYSAWARNPEQGDSDARELSAASLLPATDPDPFVTDIVLLSVDDLLPIEGPRAAGLDLDHVRALAQVVSQLPAIVVHHGTGRVVDGMHRVAAARLNNLLTIRARYLHASLDDAFLWAVQANVIHGLPLSMADRRRAAARIIGTHPHLSDRRVARVAGLAAGTVGSLRSTLKGHGHAAVRIGSDGRLRPLNTDEGRLAAGRIIEQRPGASLREIAREAGISIGTARDVRLRLAAGEEPVLARRQETARGARPNTPLPPTELVVDVEEQLKMLRRDPALRYTDTGRSFLHWLGNHVITTDEWRSATSELPTHCGDRVAAIARECSRVWARLAEEAEAA